MGKGKNKRKPLSGGKVFGIAFGASLLAMGIIATIIIIVMIYLQFAMIGGLMGMIPSP